MGAPQVRKTFSYGFITGCTSVLLLSATVAAGYGMSRYFRDQPRIPAPANQPAAVPPANQAAPPKPEDPPPARKLTLTPATPQVEPIGVVACKIKIDLTVGGLELRKIAQGRELDIVLEQEWTSPKGEKPADLAGKIPTREPMPAGTAAEAVVVYATATVPLKFGAGRWSVRLTVTDNVGKGVGSIDVPVTLDQPKAPDPGKLQLILVSSGVESKGPADHVVSIVAQASGFAVAERGGKTVHDLVVDLEAAGADGKTIPGLGKKGMVRSQEPGDVDNGAVPFNFSLPLSGHGALLVRLTVTDNLGKGTARLEVPFDLGSAGEEEKPPDGVDKAALEHFQLAQQLAAKGEREKAVEEYTQALAAQPGLTAALLNRGNLLDDLGRFDEAITDYEAVQKAEPNNVAAINNLAWVYRNKGAAEKALKYANWALQTDATYARTYLVRGLLMEDAGKFKEAVADFKKFLELDPDSASAVQVKAKIKELQERKK